MYYYNIQDLSTNNKIINIKFNNINLGLSYKNIDRFNVKNKNIHISI